MTRNRRRAQISVAAAVAAVGVVLLGGVGYRRYSSILNRADQRVVFAENTLRQSIPATIGRWKGEELSMDEYVVRAADVDDYLLRVYERDRTRLTLYIAAGVRARDLLPHRPEVCYPTHGWTVQSVQSVEIPSAGQAISARLFQFTPSNLAGNGILVLNYYIVDGETCADVSLLRAKAQQGQTALRYVAQVQVVASLQSDVDGRAAAAAQEFAALIAPTIRTILERESGPANALNADAQTGRSSDAR